MEPPEATTVAELELRLEGIWDALAKMGAVVDRDRAARVRASAGRTHRSDASRAALRCLVAQESERLRVLSSREGWAWRRARGL